MKPIPTCPPKEEENSKNNRVYSRDFQAMLDGLDEEDSFEEAVHSAAEKKRRLSTTQVKALENNFEFENKLEPERKVKLAEELGLQPRQVAIWFQNRRARWKTKQLEKDFALLKASYDALKHDYNNLEQEKQASDVELTELKSQLKEENSESSHTVKDCPKFSQQCQDHEICDNDEAAIKEESNGNTQLNGSSSSSDSSNHNIRFQPSGRVQGNNNMYQQHQALFLKDDEEQCCMFAADAGAEEPCNFLSVDQPPTLQWYFIGQ